MRTLDISGLSNHVAWIAVLTSWGGGGENEWASKSGTATVTWTLEGFSPSEEQEGPLEPENLRLKCSVLQGPSSLPVPCLPFELEA